MNGGRRSGVVRPSKPHSHLDEAALEFIVWSESPAGTRLPLPRSLVDELLGASSCGFWLQADGCYSRASWVVVEVSASGAVALARGWQTFARACGLGGRCTLHFKYGDDSTLFVRVFGEVGRRTECCPKDNGGGEVLGLGDDRSSSSYGGSFLSGSSSSGGYDQPPRTLQRRQWVVSSPRLREARGGV